MKKLFLLVGLCFVFIQSGYSAKDPSLAEVLAWRYGDVASTCQKNQTDMSATPEMEICGWKSIEKQPSEAEIAQIKSDYLAAVTTEASSRAARKQAVMEKLKLEAGDILGLQELIKDGDDK